MANMVPYRRENRALRHPFHMFRDSYLNPFAEMDSFFSNAAFRVDVKDKEDHYELNAELPGVSQENIEVSVDDGVLTIAANMNTETHEERENYVYNERRSGRFHRRFSLDGINAEGIAAGYKDGVLNITLPKEEAAEKETKRVIEIQ